MPRARRFWTAALAAALLLTAGGLGTKYLNLIFPVGRGDQVVVEDVLRVAVHPAQVLPLAAQDQRAVLDAQAEPVERRILMPPSVRKRRRVELPHHLAHLRAGFTGMLQQDVVEAGAFDLD